MNPEIPIYVVQRQDGKGPKRTLHRNMLMPFFSLPLPRVDDGHSIPSRRVTRSQAKQYESADEMDSDSSTSDEEELLLIQANDQIKLRPEAPVFFPRSTRLDTESKDQVSKEETLDSINEDTLLEQTHTQAEELDIAPTAELPPLQQVDSIPKVEETLEPHEGAIESEEVSRNRSYEDLVEKGNHLKDLPFRKL